MKGEYGVRSRGQVLEILLEGVLGDSDEVVEDLSDNSEDHHQVQNQVPEASSLVLIRSASSDQEPTFIEPPPEPSGGIDLPGFVRRRTSQLRETLHSPKPIQDGADDPLLLKLSLIHI